MATTTLKTKTRATGGARRVASKHHILVRVSHWLNIPFLLGLGVSGLSVYWASPVYKHAPDPQTGNSDYLADAGTWIVRHVPGLHRYATPETWVYDHLGSGTGQLASALNLHWLFAYLFMANFVLSLVGSGLGGGYKALLPRRGDVVGVFQMMRYYLGLPFAKILRRPWHHPEVSTKYNPLQRAAYFSVPLMTFLAIATGWAIHKPTQLGWLAWLFGGYDYARVWHFWLMWAFLAFVIPHVILVIADGWDTLRSMVTGWTTKTPATEAVVPSNAPGADSNSTPHV